MRWFFAVLLVINGIYFVWGQQSLERASNTLAEAPQVTPGAQALRLLNEHKSNAKLQRAAPAAEPVAAAPASDSALPASRTSANGKALCRVIGPFDGAISAQQFITRMQARDINVNLVEMDVPGGADFWVHVPPQASREAALKLLTLLQARKVDSYLITEGELNNGISLGVFSDKQDAMAMKQERASLGVDVRVKEISRARRELWVTFPAQDAQKFSKDLWEHERNDFVGAELRDGYCNEIAQAAPAQ